MQYRPEIDGLRAIAVLPVILFHAGFQLFSGGFVGVDVFFVISGYLITTILLGELETGQFSILNFYERRARRVLPALFLVMTSCLPFAWLWLMPSDAEQFSRSALAVLVFASNIFFWQRSDYFDPAAELKPLLHTWSLAVEEQFYLLFPIFLLLLWRWGHKPTVGILTIGSLLSLTFAQFGMSREPEAVFFLLPFRGWELTIGALIAFFLRDNERDHWPLAFSQVLSIAGLGLIIWGAVAFDKETPLPGVYALVPTIGAGLIILCAVPKTIVGQLLGSRVCAGVGLLSYSAYLWHQPLLAFARHRSLTEPNDVVLTGLIILTFGLAYLTWRYIETPFRQKTIVPKQWLWRFALVSAVIIASSVVSLQLSTHQSHSALRSKMEKLYRVRSCMFEVNQTFETLIQNRCHAMSASPVQTDLDVPRTSRTFVLYGDSVAAHLYPGLLTVATKDNVLQLTGGSCPAVRSTRSTRCADFYDWFVDEFVPNSHADAIMVSSRWLQAYEKMGEKEFRVRLNNLFEKLKGNRVIVYSQPVQLAVDVERYVYKLEKFALETPRHLEMDARSLEAVNSVLKEESSGFEFEFIDLSKMFCSEAKCQVAIDGTFYFWDTIHLTLAGSIRVAEVTSSLLASMYEEHPYGGKAQLKKDDILSNNAIMVRNLNGTIRYWSEGAKQLYGWESKDVQGLTSHHLLGTTFPVPIEVINEVLRLKGHWDGQLIHKRRDGSEIVVASHWELQQNQRLKDRSSIVIELNRFPNP